MLAGSSYFPSARALSRRVLASVSFSDSSTSTGTSDASCVFAITFTASQRTIALVSVRTRFAMSSASFGSCIDRAFSAAERASASGSLWARTARRRMSLARSAASVTVVRPRSSADSRRTSALRLSRPPASCSKVVHPAGSVQRTTHATSGRAPKIQRGSFTAPSGSDGSTPPPGGTTGSPRRSPSPRACGTRGPPGATGR